MSESDGEWICVYTSDQPHRIKIVKMVLEDNNITSFEVNKRDSAYISIGEIQLYVQAADAALAGFLIKKNEL
jgi:hypothetical protein